MNCFSFFRKHISVIESFSDTILLWHQRGRRAGFRWLWSCQVPMKANRTGCSDCGERAAASFVHRNPCDHWLWKASGSRSTSAQLPDRFSVLGRPDAFGQPLGETSSFSVDREVPWAVLQILNSLDSLCVPSFTRFVRLFLVWVALKCYTEPRLKPTVPCLLVPLFLVRVLGIPFILLGTQKYLILFASCESGPQRCFAWWLFLCPGPEGTSILMLCSCSFAMGPVPGIEFVGS